MFNLLKKVWYSIKNKQLISRIKSTLRLCDDILEEKGYHRHKDTYKIKDHNLYINICYYKNPVDNLPFKSIIKDGIVTVKWTTLLALIDISLDIYCWCCLLPPLQGSRYQQYQRMCMPCVNDK